MPTCFEGHLSTMDDLAKETAHAEPVQDKKLSHTKPEAKATNRTPQRLPSPPETPGPGTPMPNHAHLQPTGVQTVTGELCLLESLLESALVAIRSTSNPTLSQTVKHTLTELNKLVDAEATAPEIVNNADTQTSPKSQGPITESIKSRLAHQLRIVSRNQQIDLYILFSKSPQTRGMCGTLFESIGLCVVPEGLEITIFADGPALGSRLKRQILSTVVYKPRIADQQNSGGQAQASIASVADDTIPSYHDSRIQDRSDSVPSRGGFLCSGL